MSRVHPLPYPLPLPLFQTPPPRVSFIHHLCLLFDFYNYWWLSGSKPAPPRFHPSLIPSLFFGFSQPGFNFGIHTPPSRVSLTHQVSCLFDLIDSCSQSSIKPAPPPFHCSLIHSPSPSSSVFRVPPLYKSTPLYRPPNNIPARPSSVSPLPHLLLVLRLLAARV